MEEGTLEVDNSLHRNVSPLTPPLRSGLTFTKVIINVLGVPHLLEDFILCDIQHKKTQERFCVLKTHSIIYELLFPLASATDLI